mmetsp:Transcript_16957/g.40830  ORF Transcript_16957/g.40830 Transcript_16957/m.40830 type:complete len:186 (-) Transcript_16957:465-1022(-)
MLVGTIGGSRAATLLGKMIHGRRHIQVPHQVLHNTLLGTIGCPRVVAIATLLGKIPDRRRRIYRQPRALSARLRRNLHILSIAVIVEWVLLVFRHSAALLALDIGLNSEHFVQIPVIIVFDLHLQKNRLPVDARREVPFFQVKSTAYGSDSRFPVRPPLLPRLQRVQAHWRVSEGEEEVPVSEAR